MKKVIVLAIMLLVALTGCGGDDGGEHTKAQADLSAVWTETQRLNDMIIALGVDQLKAKVDDLTASNQALQSALDKTIADTAGNYAQITDIKTALTTLETALNNTIATMATKAEAAYLQSQISAAVNNIASNSSTISTLQTQVAAIQIAVTALQTDSATASADIAALKTNIATLQATITALQEQITDMAGGLVKITTTVEGAGTIKPVNFNHYWPKGVAGAVLSVEPAPGNYFAGIGGTCTGVLNGYTYSIQQSFNDCMVMASFAAAPVYYFEYSFGSSGSGPGQYLDVHSVKVEDGSGNLIITDSSNSRITKVSPTGSFISDFGSTGAAPGQLWEPVDTATDAAGNIYVVELGNARVSKFDAMGNFLSTFGSLGTGVGQLQTPSGIALDSAGNIVVMDEGNTRIQIFDASSGTAIRSFDIATVIGGKQITAFALDQDDNMYVGVSGLHNEIFRYDKNGVLLNSISQYPEIGDWSLTAITVKNNKVFAVVADGIKVFEAAGGHFITSFARPVGAYYNDAIGVDTQDNMYVYDNGADTINRIAH